jgi:parvulin-like peptidyl-prolyl isomerase
MSRSTLMALAISCALGCACYAQDSAAKPQPPAPAASNPAQSPAPATNGGPPMAPPAPPPAATLPSTSVVPMTEPVLTLKGACQPKDGSEVPAGCVTSLTREQFEKLVKALTPPDRPPMPPDVMRNFATQYAKLLIFSDAARSMGMENDPRVIQIMAFAKNQILTEALNQHITEEYSHPTDQQIEDYYKENSKKYVEATLLRIIIPRNQGNSTDKPKPSEADEKAYVEKLRERWIAGEDPEKLEKEAADHFGLTTPAANPNVGPRRPGTLPEAHEPVFDLKPGEFSAVFSDPASFYIYKVVSVRTVPLSEAKESIATTLKRQLVADKIAQIQNSVTPILNDAYFGPEKPPAPPTPRIITPRRTAPPPGADAPPQPNPGNAPPPAPPQ